MSLLCRLALWVGLLMAMTSTRAQSQTFEAPIPGAPISNGYAQFLSQPKRHDVRHHHTGIDLAGAGVTVGAAADGVVVAKCPGGQDTGCPGFSTNDSNHGLDGVVILRHDLASGTVYTLYAHLTEESVDSMVPEPPGEVKRGDPLGITRADRAHLHFEAKSSPVLHNPVQPSDPVDGCVAVDQDPLQYNSQCWGYVLTDPDDYGYVDPMLYLATPQSVAFPLIEVNDFGQGAFLRKGPGYDPVVGALSARERFAALGVASPTSSCSHGWYQAANVDGTYFDDVPKGTRGDASLPDVWICRGNGDERWLDPLYDVSVALDSAATGDLLDSPHAIAVDGSGTLFVAGQSDHVWRVPSSGPPVLILDSSGDGTTSLNDPEAITVDDAGNVFVASGYPYAVFRIDPEGAVSVVIDSTGDGNGNDLRWPRGLAVEESGDLLVSGYWSDNVFRVSPSGEINEILNSTGDGSGNSLASPIGLAIGPNGAVYVAGFHSDNLFRVNPEGTIDLLVDSSGDGMGNELTSPRAVAVNAQGHVFVAGSYSSNVFAVDPDGTVVEVLDGDGDGVGNGLVSPRALAIGPYGTLFVSSWSSHNVLRLFPSGAVQQIIGLRDGLSVPEDVALDPMGDLFVPSGNSDSVLRVGPLPAVCDDGIDNDLDRWSDHVGDPGCRDAAAIREDPQCQDGINNDPGEDGFVDFDGGLSALGYVATAPDPECQGTSWRNCESNRCCGLGFELALLLPGLMWLYCRNRERTTSLLGE